MSADTGYALYIERERLQNEDTFATSIHLYRRRCLLPESSMLEVTLTIFA